MPAYPRNEQVRVALEALKALRHSYETGLTPWKLSDKPQLDGRAAVYQNALAAVRHPAVVKLLDDAVSSIVEHGPGTNTSAGIEILGRIDLTRLAKDDLEVELSKLIGFDSEDVADSIKLARKTLRVRRRRQNQVPVCDASMLPSILAMGHESFERERRARAGKYGSDRKHNRRVWNGCIHAVWIIIANAEYPRQEFARSYHFGSGLAVALS